MTIKEVLSSSHDSKVEFKGVLTGATTQMTKANTEMLTIALVDATSAISFPLFVEVDELKSQLEIGAPYKVTAVVNIWNGNTQLKGEGQYRAPKFEKLEKGQYSSSDFVGVYEIPSSFIKIFIDTICGMSSPYKEIVIEATGCMGSNPELWDRFINCPSAKKKHGNKIGGLFLHTLGVLSNIMNMISLYEKFGMYGDIHKVINKDRMILKAIIHDVMKINEYVYDTHIDIINGVVGHIYDGMAYVDEINKKLGCPLERSEIEDIKTSILSHHGQYGPAEPKTLENTLIHLADMVDSRIVGEIESSK